MKKISKSSGLVLLIASIFFIHSCKKDDPVPPTVTTATVTDISYTTATSGGDVTAEGGGPVISKGVCWSTSANPTIDDTKTTESAGSGAFISNITDLTQNTMYYVRAYATNADGTGYGNQVSFTTTQIAVPELTTVDITAITQTTASSGGNITDENGGSVTARGVCWSTSENPTISDSKTEDGTGTGTFVSSITGLTGNTTYYLRAYATNSAGTQYGNQLSFLTSPVEPTLTTEEVSSITVTSVESGGNITSDGGASVTARGVCWSTTENPTISDSKTEDGTGTGAFSSSLTGLSGNTKYYVRAFATNSAGTSYGNELSFTTFTVSDIDGNFYSSIIIGTQTWLVENLKATTYNNGDPIPGITDQTEWNNLSSGAYCNYDNNTTNSTVYGRLYNYFAVVDSRKLCPSGWHVPTKTEFQTLSDYVGSTGSAKLRETGDTHWINNPPTPSGTDDFGFNALPGGNRNDTGFYTLGSYGIWWSSTHEYPDYSTVLQLSNDTEYISILPTREKDGYSVRCIKD